MIHNKLKSIVFLMLAVFTCVLAQDMPLVYKVENTGADVPAPYMVSIDDLPEIEALPDPFEWSDGRGRIVNKSDWRVRRAEIKAEIEHYEIGEKPTHYDSLTATFEDNLLTVNITVNNNTLTLTSPILLPEGDGPFPGIIGVGFGGTGSLPADIFTSRNVAQIPFNFGQVMAHTQNRGNEPINALYPELEYMGAYSAWSWGISRLIDGMELVSDSLNIDLEKLAITGCSFAGKMALFAGAFDERIALTISQESGGGGYTTWRVSETLGNVETLANTSRAWFILDLFQFAADVPKLPYDHHELMALVAPRALLVTGNPDYEWLADESGYVGSMATKEVYKALGIENRFGYSIIAGHGHCAVPNSQIPEIEAFVEKFLLGNNEADTNIETTPYNTDLTPWINWETPELGDETSFLDRSSLLFPENGQTQLDTSLTFEWSPVDDAAQYYFQLSTDPTFKTMVINDSLENTAKTVAGLFYAKKYYWRVQVKNILGELGPWSVLSNFATFITLPTQPELVAATPPLRQANRITLEWKSVENADDYLVQISDDDSFANILLSAETPDTSENLNGTVEGQEYFWRVNARNIGGSSPWSDVWNFMIILKPTSFKANITGDNEITLLWSDKSQVEDGYVIERKFDGETSFAVIDTAKGQDIEEYVDKAVIANETYKYRIKAYKGMYSSAYSNEATRQATSVEQKNLPTEFSLSQNFPNPFNPVTQINFAIPTNSPTVISIFDLLGREMMTLLDQRLQAGYHNLTANLGHLPSGVYFYKIQAGDFSQHKKMILMK